MVAEALITWDFREEVVLGDYPSLKKYLLCWMRAEEKEELRVQNEGPA